VRAHDGASRSQESQRERDWSDEGPIVPRQDDDTSSTVAGGQDDAYSSASAGPVGGAPPMSDGGLDDDRYVAHFDGTPALITTSSKAQRTK
jgi:hypothetical protein